MKAQIQTVAEFFKRDDVKAFQEVQKRWPAGSAQHRDAFEQMSRLAMQVGGDIGEYLGTKEDEKKAAKKLWRLRSGLLYVGLKGEKTALVSVGDACVFDGRDNAMSKQAFFSALLGVAFEVEWI